LRVRFATEVHVADADARFPQQRIEVPERFARDMLEDEQLAHLRL
jgi:hypothetical protein